MSNTEGDLAGAMEWTERGVQAMLAENELSGTLLHLIGTQGEADVVLLNEELPLALHAARALIVVRRPVIATVALEAWGAHMDERSLQDDPYLRDWWRRRQAGEDVAVRDLPADYLMELLIVAGESADGARALRSWRISGTAPHRTFTPRPSAEQTLGEAPLHPLFIQEQAVQSGIDPTDLRRKAQHFLSRTHKFEEIYNRDREKEQEGER